MRSQTDIVLNDEQQRIVKAHDGNYVVIAAPGTGKTETLVRRYLDMLTSGIPSQDMLNLTFTAAGATAMAKRVGIINAESVFRTFHSFALNLLKQERDSVPFSLCDTIIPVEQQDYQLLFELIKIWPALNWRTLQEKIAAWKCDNILPDQAIDESKKNGLEYFYSLAYCDYEIKCRERGWLDFDSLIRETINLLETNDDVRKRWQKKYLAIDECQDTDVCQIRLLELLYDKNIMIIGDMCQGIFEWRSAAPDSLTSYIRTLPDVQTLFLGQNYRSTKELVSFFKEILPIDYGVASHMITDNENGFKPTFTEYKDADEEAEQILRRVKDPVNTAIIARTNRQLFTFQRICLLNGVKYKILGKRDLFEQNEVKRLLKLAKDASEDSRPATIVLTNLIQQYDLLRLYQHSGRPTESNPIENLNSIVKMSANKGTIEEFLTFLRKLTHARKSSKGLILSTAHQAKGLEFDYVYVIGVKQGQMPHEKGEIGEERRIWYVSCTRAAKELHISFYKPISEFLLNYQDRIVSYQGEQIGTPIR